jgi:hypothetical protein
VSDITVLIISYAARTAVLTLLLWIMVQLQKLNYSFPGLLGSAALACALDTIPYFGHYLAVPVLYLCIWKVTQASLMPDAVFTVVISYALMFGVKVLLLTAILPTPHPLAGDRDQSEPSASMTTDSPDATDPAAADATNTPKGSVRAPAPAKSADEWLNDVIVKGATENGDKSTLLLTAQKKLYTLALNKPTVLQTTNGACHIRLLNVSENWAMVEVNGETTYLRLH